MLVSNYRADEVGAEQDGQTWGRFSEAVQEHRKLGFGQVQVLEGIKLVMPSANPTVVSGANRIPTASEGLGSLARGITLAAGLS